jgi:hypothetical protein
MVWLKSFLPDCQCPLEKRLGLRIPALAVINRPQIVEAPGYVGVLRLQRLFADRQRVADAPTRARARLTKTVV